jgi:hypothetical protein
MNNILLQLSRILKSLFRRLFYLHRQMIFFSCKKEQIRSGRDVVVREGDMQDYQRIAKSELFFAQHLKHAKGRLLEGDKLYLVMQDGEFAHAAWVRLRDTLDASYELGAGGVKQLGDVVPIIYDCWTPKSFQRQGFYPASLHAISCLYFPSHQDVWIYCLATNKASAKGIERAGFQRRFSIDWWRYVGYFPRYRVNEL